MKKMRCDLMEVTDNGQVPRDNNESSSANALEEIVLELFVL